MIKRLKTILSKKRKCNQSTIIGEITSNINVSGDSMIVNLKKTEIPKEVYIY